MPAEPDRSEQPLEGVDGVLMYRFRADDQAAMIVYSVSFADYKINNPDLLAQIILEGVCSARRDKTEYRIVKEEEITLDGHPGREIVSEVSDRAEETYRTYLVGKRLYQLTATDAGGGKNAADVSKFFESFELLSDDQDADRLVL